jgi:hypothetical protein
VGTTALLISDPTRRRCPIAPAHIRFITQPADRTDDRS